MSTLPVAHINGHDREPDDARRRVLVLAREHGGNARAMFDRIDIDDGDVMNELLRLGCERAIELAHAEMTPRKPAPATHRGPRVNGTRLPAAYSPPPTTGNAMAARLRTLAPAYDWPLPNGAQLGAASIADLDHAIAAHSVKAQAHVGWVKFYTAVKAKVVRQRAHTVADVLSAAELLRLKTVNGVKDDE